MLQLFLLVFGLFFPPAEPKMPAAIPYDYCNTTNYSWQGGEEVTYKLYYQLNFLWLPAGEATFKVKDLGDRYFISIDGKTISAFEWFYKVKDRYESIIDKQTLLPISFSRDISEGKYVWWDKFDFDQVHNKVQASKGWPDKPTKYYSADLSGCMHDMISIIYNVRNVDFDQYQPGDKFNVKVYVEEEYPLEVEVREKYQMTRIHGMGKAMTHLIRPQVVSGHFFNQDTRMDVYISADNNRIPLMIESPVSVGKVKAVLTDYKGLRYPLLCKR
ncbi:MAG TPA: DUF3108 domain-containing protein [Saprospiraceae bacterium]|nr:DUF3108 domain-containing protein [Saprospiraceae bacterium]